MEAAGNTTRNHVNHQQEIKKSPSLSTTIYCTNITACFTAAALLCSLVVAY